MKPCLMLHFSPYPYYISGCVPPCYNSSHAPCQRLTMHPLVTLLCPPLCPPLITLTCLPAPLHSYASCCTFVLSPPLQLSTPSLTLPSPSLLHFWPASRPQRLPVVKAVGWLGAQWLRCLTHDYPVVASSSLTKWICIQTHRIALPVHPPSCEWGADLG